MSIKNSMAEASQAIINSVLANFFVLEAVIFGVVYGLYKSSWISGFLAFLIFVVMIYIPNLNYVFATFMTFSWVYATRLITDSFGNGEMTHVFTFIAYVTSGTIHFSSIENGKNIKKL